MSTEHLQERIKKLEVENESLRFQLKQKNTRNAGRKPYITANDVTRMKKMQEEGKSYAFIGQFFGVSSTTVYKKLNPHSV